MASFRQRSKTPVLPADPFWSRFDHAYGNGADLPALFAKMAVDWHDPIWGELWSRLCHQGTVYTASAAAVPELLRFAQSLPASQRIAPLSLAGAIAARLQPPDIPNEITGVYQDALSRGQALAVEGLSAEGISRSDLVGYLEAYSAFQGYAPFGQWLSDIANDEMELGCVSCDSIMWIHPISARVSVEDLEALTVIRPFTGSLPASVEDIRNLASQHGESALADAFTLMFAEAACPRCGHVFIPASERNALDIMFPAFSDTSRAKLEATPVAAPVISERGDRLLVRCIILVAALTIPWIVFYQAYLRFRVLKAVPSTPGIVHLALMAGIPLLGVIVPVAVALVVKNRRAA